MSVLVGPAVDAVLDKLDATTKAALISVGATEDILVGVGHAAVNIADKTADQLFEEAESTRQRLMVLLRAIANTATAPLP